MSDVESLLRRNGWVLRRSAKHNIWACPCGEHMTSLSKTSSDHRSDRNKIADLRRMGCPSLAELRPSSQGKVAERCSVSAPSSVKEDVQTVYVCIICRRDITRRTSYALAPGKRACRHHHGVG
jgi:hypothetical protein